MSARPFVYLSDDDVRELLDVKQAIRIAEETLLAHARDQVDWCEPRQILLRPAGSDTVYKQKACALRDINVAGMRVIGLNRSDEGIALALHHPSKYILPSDPDTGLFFCIMDEHWSHAVRTGVCVAVAAKYLARPESRVIGMIGAGFMAKATLLALQEAGLFPIDEVRVYSKRAASREAYAREMHEGLGLNVVACDTPQPCARPPTCWSRRRRRSDWFSTAGCALACSCTAWANSRRSRRSSTAAWIGCTWTTGSTAS